MGTLAEKQCQSRFCLRLRLHPFESLPQHLATRRPLFANHLSVAKFPLEFGDQLSEFIDGTCRDTVGQIYSCASRKSTLFLSVDHLCRDLECQLSPPAANLYQLSGRQADRKTKTGLCDSRFPRFRVACRKFKPCVRSSPQECSVFPEQAFLMLVLPLTRAVTSVCYRVRQARRATAPYFLTKNPILADIQSRIGFFLLISRWLRSLLLARHRFGSYPSHLNIAGCSSQRSV